MSDKKIHIILILIGFSVFYLISILGKAGNFFLYDNLLYLRSKFNSVNTHELPITFICIDDASLKKINDWPIPRKYYALALRALKAFGAKSVLFDILFLSPSKDDNDFAIAIKDFGKVFLPTATSFQSKNTLDRGKIEQILSINAYKKGIIFIKPDEDGKRRRIPLIQKNKAHNTQLYNIAFLAGLDILNVPTSQLEIKPKKISFMKTKELGELETVTIPTDQEHQILLDYPDTWQRAYNKIPFSTLIEIYLRKKTGQKLSAKELNLIKKIRDSCCIIGVTALGTPDLAATPLESRCPMLMTHGVIISSLLLNRFIKPLPKIVSFIFFIILLLPSILTSQQMKKLWITWISLSLTLMLSIILLFVFFGIYIKIFAPILSSLIVTILISVHIYIVNLKQKQKIEYEMALASEIQKKMLPDKLPSLGSISCEVFFKPAIFVAGDFYDVWKSDNSLFLLLGDVSGKGASAALYVSSIITVERVLRNNYKQNKAESLLTDINRFLSKNKISGLYATACLLEIEENGNCKIIDAGHTGIWIYRKETQTIEEIKGIIHKPLGIDKWEKYVAHNFFMNNKDMLFIFTDGFLEARRGEEFIDKKELKEWLIENIDLPLCAIDHYMEEFYQGAEQSDDITVFIIRKTE